MYGIMQSICICGLWPTIAYGVGMQGVGGVKLVVMIYQCIHRILYSHLSLLCGLTCLQLYGKILFPAVIKKPLEAGYHQDFAFED